MPERPRLHLDFNSPCTPPPIYSPHFSPTSPPLSFTPTRRSSTSSTTSTAALDSPRTPSTPKIIMGAMVFTPEPKSMSGGGNGESESEDEEWEGEMSLEVPGIVLTEPPRQPTPRLPSPPPKQVVLLAPCSLPLPSSQLQIQLQSSSKDSKTPLSFSSQAHNQNLKPQFSSTFLKLLGHPTPSPSKKRSSLKMVLLLSIMILGVWHLWSTLEIGLTVGLVEEASLIL